jgi:hypothetical protein
MPPLKSRIMSKISQSEHEIFLCSDFEKMSGYRQVGRVLNQLISESVLIRVGYGLMPKIGLAELLGNQWRRQEEALLKLLKKLFPG